MRRDYLSLLPTSYSPLSTIIINFMKTIFITGGAGFIGSAFIRLVLEETSDTQIINFDALTYAGNLG